MEERTLTIQLLDKDGNNLEGGKYVFSKNKVRYSRLLRELYTDSGDDDDDEVVPVPYSIDHNMFKIMWEWLNYHENKRYNVVKWGINNDRGYTMRQVMGYKPDVQTDENDVRAWDADFIDRVTAPKPENKKFPDRPDEVDHEIINGLQYVGNYFDCPEFLNLVLSKLANYLNNFQVPTGFDFINLKKAFEIPEDELMPESHIKAIDEEYGHMFDKNYCRGEVQTTGDDFDNPF